MFVQSAEFVKAHGGKRTDISIYGQEFTDTTWRLAKMNLALRGIEADLGDRSADSFTQDLHPDLRADFVLANPPFNVSQLVGRQARRTTRAGSTARRPKATPTSPGYSTSSTTCRRRARPASSSPTARCRRKTAARARSAASSSRPTSWTASLRCRTSCSSTQASRSACGSSLRTDTATVTASAQGEVLFIDARKLGRMETRRLRVLDDDDIAKIAGHLPRLAEPRRRLRGCSRLRQGRDA